MIVLAVDLVASMLTAGAAVAVAMVALLGTGYTHLASGLSSGESALQRQQAVNRNLRLYCRDLIDMYYRHRVPDALDPGPIPQEAE